MVMRRLVITILALVVTVPAAACVFGGDDDTPAATPTGVGQVAGARTAGSGAPLATATPSASPTPTRPTEYVVKAGDTLSEIAERFSLTTDALAAANTLIDLDTLAIGDVLKIPAAP